MKTWMILGLSFLSGLCHSQDVQPSKSWFDQVMKAGSQIGSKTWDSTKKLSSDALDGTIKLGSETWNATADTRSKAWDATKKLSSDAVDGTVKLSTEAWNATADTRSKAWDATKKLSSDAVDGTVKLSTEAWNATADTRSKAWDKSKALASETWDTTALKTEQFYKEHETGIKAAGAAIAVGAALYFGNQLSSSSSPETISSLQGPYSNIPDSGAVKAGGFFSDSAKRQILNENMARNGGVLKSDLSGTVLTLPGQYTKGYSPSPAEAQIDHLFPRSQGGTNSFGNAQILSRQENLLKGATVPK